jgi:hypothetical protein
VTGWPLILDTNLLVLYVVGTASRHLIDQHKRLNEFDASDYDILQEWVIQAPAVLITPNTLTETSNLATQIHGEARKKVLAVLKAVTESCREVYIPSEDAAARPEFLLLGLTDAALLDDALREATLLTTDLRLFVAAQAKGSPAVNFNHLRDPGKS